MLPLRDSLSHHGPALVTKLLVIINVLAFLAQVSGGPAGFEQGVIRYSLIPALLFENPLAQSYRLVTSMFMHGGVAHLLGNMWFLWVFGPALENRLGGGRYLGLYLLTGIVAGLAQAALTADSITPVVGASGAVSGVLGGYFILFNREFVFSVVWLLLPLFVWVPVSIYLGYWALIQVVYALMGVPGTAWWAHIGGFVAGLLLARQFRRRNRYKAQPYWQEWFD